MSDTPEVFGETERFRVLPQKLVGAGLVIVDGLQRVLLVQPTCKDIGKFQEAW